MANYKLVEKKQRILTWDTAELVARRILAGLAMVAVLAVALKLLGLNPEGSVLALAINYKFVDAKFGMSTSGLLGLNLTRGVWKAATQYNVGDTVQNGGFAYRCSVAGISAAAPGPSPNTLVDNAATWVLIGPVSGLCVQDAAAAQELGYQAVAKDDVYGIGTFVYCKFTGVTVAGDFVIFNQQGVTGVQTPAAAPGAGAYSKIGISMGNQVNGSYGWVMVQGVHDQANLAAAGTVGNILYGSAVAGRAATAVVANYIIDGSVLRNAGVVGTATVELWWPSCSGR